MFKLLLIVLLDAYLVPRNLLLQKLHGDMGEARFIGVVFVFDTPFS